MKEITFERFTKMIDKKAWEVSKKTGIDFEELQAQGALIYCKTLENYDVSKSSFSTILYIALNGLYEYAIYYKGGNKKHKKGYAELSEKVEKSLVSMNASPSISDLLSLAKEKLSEDSYKLIEWMINRSWEFQGRLKPCMTMVMKKFNWDRNYSKVVWNECKDFWNTCGWTIYC